MTPDELRLATDPNARNDPDFVRRMAQGRRTQMRDRVFGTLRMTCLVMGLVGVVALAVGGLLATIGVVGMVAPRGALPVGFPPLSPMSALGPLIVGGVFVGLAIWLWVPSQSLRKTGREARAQVMQVLSMGSAIRVKGPSFVGSVGRVTVLLRVMPPNAAPYDVTHSERILTSDLSHLQNGATVPVRVSPSNAHKLALDFDAIG